MMKGGKVIVLHGASDWMKSRNYWLKDMPESIDGLVGEIIGDYTSLKGDDCHYEIAFDEYPSVGVHPQWLIHESA